jgi:hypothetical protein
MNLIHCLESIIAIIDEFKESMVINGLNSYIIYENSPFNLDQLLATARIFHFLNALSYLAF